MAIAYVNGVVSHDTSGTTSSTVPVTATMPGSIVAGNLLIASVYLAIYPPTGIVVTANAPSGWTLLQSDFGSTAKGVGTYALFYRVATGSESASYVFSFSFGGGDTENSYITASVAQYSGTDTTTPIDVSGVSDTGTGNPTSLALPSVNATVIGTQIGIWNSYNARTITPPSGFTTRLTDTVGADFTTIFTDHPLTATGATGTPAATFSSTDSEVAATAVLAPSSGGGGGGGISVAWVTM